MFIYAGPLASTVGVSYLAFLKGRKIHPSLDIPNYELYFAEMPTSIVKKQFGLKSDVSIINYIFIHSMYCLDKINLSFVPSRVPTPSPPS